MLPSVDFNFVFAGIATFAATAGYMITRNFTTDIFQLSPDVHAGCDSSVPLPEILDPTVIPPSRDHEEGTSSTTFLCEAPLGGLSSERTNDSLGSGNRRNLKRKVADSPEPDAEGPSQYCAEKQACFSLLDYSSMPMTEIVCRPTMSARLPMSLMAKASPCVPIQKIVGSKHVLALPSPSVSPQLVQSCSPEPCRRSGSRKRSATPPSSNDVVSVTPEDKKIEESKKVEAAESFADQLAASRQRDSLTLYSGGFSAFTNSKACFSTSGSTSDQPRLASWVSSGDAGKATDIFQAPSALDTPRHALLGQESVEHEKPKVFCATGEEDEDVVAEIKRLKLFVKRGTASFSSGILGSIRLLVHRETGVQRLLFRREALYQVAMNVRLSPLVHTVYDKEEAALRVIVTEPSEHAPQDGCPASTGKSCPATTFHDFIEKVVGASSSIQRASSEPAPEPEKSLHNVQSTARAETEHSPNDVSIAP
ncbi:hypothetical protein FISHEDRAFT_56356 [Fistulina hepatica ATCC 64428]|uniref:RanBD1 domain-containing protein n=1 Tax=Fistulina hepatica ATCC 64428 TaxID=1128425 RepID=A0A0D7AJY4_9AGAR|nr:hypothetical protein FISHEDRAFT_56356 [Fistulina hepatica ATCC 64428]